MQESENVLRILKETKEAIKEEDNIKLKNLSNQTVHTASVSQDPENIAIAVIVYSLSKILERPKYREYSSSEKLFNEFGICIDNLIIDIKEKNSKRFAKELTHFRAKINKLSGKLKIYVQEVFRKASINKASRIYEHGISMERTAKLLGITMFELANYAGQTGISDVPESNTADVKSRIKLAMEMFR